MRVLCTFPGKFGDILWSLPTVRAISESIGEPVDLWIGASYESIVPLLRRQSYLGNVVSQPLWQTHDTAPMSPRVPPFEPWPEYDQIYHLGYRGWPSGNLAVETRECAKSHSTLQPSWYIDEHWSIDRPWITPPYKIDHSISYAVGFTDEHFELKFGVTAMLWKQDQLRQSTTSVNLANSPRWNTESPLFTLTYPYEWESAAAWLGIAPAFVGCNSALHVLARAMGVPVVMMEPNPQRHHEIFYPYGKSGNGVELVVGNDGLPTFDSRHVWETLCRVLDSSSAASSATTTTFHFFSPTGSPSDVVIADEKPLGGK